VARLQDRMLTDYGLESRLLSTMGLTISSSMVREAVAQGQPIDHLVPAPVADYIKRHDLYRSAKFVT